MSSIIANEIINILAPKNLKIYQQNAFKIAIKYTNPAQSAAVVPINFIRGNDGSVEVKDIQPGETRYIAIEPSSKKYKFYKNTEEYAGAAYPKKPDQIKTAWRPIERSADIRRIHQKLKNKGFVIPYYQIADYLVSLGIVQNKTITDVADTLEINRYEFNMGFPGKIKIFRPISVALGFKLTKAQCDSLSTNNIGALTTTYGTVPIQEAMLINIELDSLFYLRTQKLRFPKNKPRLVYPIDAAAVEAALWESVPQNKLVIEALVSEYYGTDSQ